VEASERNLREFRHEVAAYGRKPEEGLPTPEDQERAHRDAVSAFSRAQGVVEFSAGVDDKYLEELRRLVAAIEPMIAEPAVRAIA
jgi:hypothetical protein